MSVSFGTGTNVRMRFLSSKAVIGMAACVALGYIMLRTYVSQHDAQHDNRTTQNQHGNQQGSQSQHGSQHGTRPKKCKALVPAYRDGYANALVLARQYGMDIPVDTITEPKPPKQITVVFKTGTRQGKAATF